MFYFNTWLGSWIFASDYFWLKIFLWQVIYDFLCSVLPWTGENGLTMVFVARFFTVTKNITSGRLISKKYRICDLSMDTGNSLTYQTYTYFWWAKILQKQLTLWYLIIWDAFRPSQMVRYVTFASGFWQAQSECFKLTTESFSVFFAFPRLLPKPPPKKENREMTDLISWRNNLAKTQPD